MKLRLFLIVLAVLFPVSGFATQFEISRLAEQLGGLSAELSRDSRGLRGFSSVSHYAARLQSKADQLSQSITRGRSTSYVRSRFSDVAQHYERLEEAYFRAGRFKVDTRVEQQFGEISLLLNLLTTQFYPDNYNPGYSGLPPVYLQYPYRYRNAPRQYQRNPQGGLDLYRNPQNSPGGGTEESRQSHREPDFDHQNDVYDRQQRRNQDGNRNRARIYQSPDATGIGGSGQRRQENRIFDRLAR